MPADPSGTPSGFFEFLDPSQEASFSDSEPGVRSDWSPNFDFVTGFEADLDSSFEVVREEENRKACERELEGPPVVEVKSSVPLVRPVSRRAPSMPTILEEDEGDEEDGDVTVTPNAVQRAFLPPDRFACPRSPQFQAAGAGAVPEDAGDDSLETPRPNGELSLCLYWVITSVIDPPNVDPTAQTSAFSVPAPDQFDASFSLEACPKESQKSHDDSVGRSEFFSSLVAGDEFANFDFDTLFNVDTSYLNGAVFGESPSQGSTPSSSSSFLELMSKEENSMEAGVSMDVGIDPHMLQFPSVHAGIFGYGDGFPTEEEFLSAVREAIQSTPKRVSRISRTYPIVRPFPDLTCVCRGWFFCGNRHPRRTLLSFSRTSVVLACELDIRGYVLVSSAPFCPLTDWFVV